MESSTRPLIIIALLSILLLGCSSTSSNEPISSINGTEIVLQSETDNHEVIQEFDLDNCNGKADATRIEHRSASIDVTISTELAAKIGASAQVVSAEVQAAVGSALSISGERGTSIELKSPPNTHMFFQLAWIGKSQIGVAQNVSGSNIPVAFQSFVPHDVRIKSQYDIGCGFTPSPTTPPDNNPQPEVVTENPSLPENLTDNDGFFRATCYWDKDWEIQPDGSYLWVGAPPGTLGCANVGQSGELLQRLRNGENITLIVEIGDTPLGLDICSGKFQATTIIPGETCASGNPEIGPKVSGTLVVVESTGFLVGTGK